MSLIFTLFVINAILHAALAGGFGGLDWAITSFFLFLFALSPSHAPLSNGSGFEKGSKQTWTKDKHQETKDSQSDGLSLLF